MKPLVAIVGRPNVGKSTLFNQLTRSRDALVADVPGVTRDIHFGHGKVGDRPYWLVDTGGYNSDGDPLQRRVSERALRAARDADAVILVVDGRDGLTPHDEALAAELRPLKERVRIAVNKTESLKEELVTSEFHALGLGQPVAISSAHAAGLHELMEVVLADFTLIEDTQSLSDGPRVAVIGRPNVGKSTLINRLLGEERMLTFDVPGTTRDAVAVPFARDGRHYTLVDTAGVRRRGRVPEGVEKFSVIKTLQAIDAANVAVLVIDASEAVTEQDAALLGAVTAAGRAVVIAVNKWDGLAEMHRQRVRADVERRLDFVDFARVHYVSALHGSGVGNLFGSIDRAFASAFVEPPASRLTDILARAIVAHPPPLVRGRRIKLRYAHLGGRNPPRIVIHGNQTEALPGAYRRYLEKQFRNDLRIEGTPLRLEFRTGANPFRDRRNTLSPRQAAKRRRLKRFAARGR